MAARAQRPRTNARGTARPAFSPMLNTAISAALNTVNIATIAAIFVHRTSRMPAHAERVAVLEVSEEVDMNRGRCMS